MAAAVIMPKLGLTMTAGAVAQWNVEEGQRVAAGDVIVEIVTEKITYQVEAEVDGVLLKIVVDEGDEVPVGTIIGVIGEPGEDAAAWLAAGGAPGRTPASGGSTGGPVPGAASTTGGTGAAVAGTRASAAGAPADHDSGSRDRAGDRAGGRVPASPAARKLAADLGVDLARVTGTGPGGRITTDDVQAAVEADAYGAPPAAPAPAPQKAPTRRIHATLPYTGVRRAIGEHMAASRAVSPTVTHHARVDVHDLVALLARLNEGRPDGERISMTAALIKATAAAIRTEPGINASLAGDVITVWEDVDIGIAVAVPEGLMVPVVRNADGKGLDEIARETARLAQRARAGGLTLDEVTGGTFTISNVGGHRSVDFFTPIINQPEAAILGAGRIRDDVVAVGGAAAVRATMGLSLTFDHRILDGAPAASFLRVLMDHLEEPERLLG